MSVKDAIPIVVSLLALGLTAGKGFKLTRWVLLFWCLAVVSGAYWFLGVRLAAYLGAAFVIACLAVWAIQRDKRVGPAPPCRLTKLPHRFRWLNPNILEVALPFTNRSRGSAVGVVAQVRFEIPRRSPHVVDYGAWDNRGPKERRVAFYPGETISLVAFRVHRMDDDVLQVEALERNEAPPTSTGWMVGTQYADYVLPLCKIGTKGNVPNRMRLAVTLIGGRYRQVFRYKLRAAAEPEMIAMT
jgi:hypothetical protein